MCDYDRACIPRLCAYLYPKRMIWAAIAAFFGVLTYAVVCRDGKPNHPGDGKEEDNDGIN